MTYYFYRDVIAFPREKQAYQSETSTLTKQFGYKIFTEMPMQLIDTSDAVKTKIFKTLVLKVLKLQDKSYLS